MTFSQHDDNNIHVELIANYQAIISRVIAEIVVHANYRPTVP